MGTGADLNRHSVERAYARWAPFYDRFFGAFTASACRIALAEMNNLPPGRVLEVGCGQEGQRAARCVDREQRRVRAARDRPEVDARRHDQHERAGAVRRVAVGDQLDATGCYFWF